MSALTGYIIKQVERTTHSTQRLRVIMALMIIIAGAGLVLLFQRAPAVVLYGGQRVLYIAPIEAEVCIGGLVHFPTVTEITKDEIPGRLEIDESWCLEGLGGACKAVTAPNPRLPMLEEKHIVTPRVERNIPATLAPGVYHFQHSATDAHGNTTGYIVAPITVKECE